MKAAESCLILAVEKFDASPLPPRNARDVYRSLVTPSAPDFVYVFMVVLYNHVIRINTIASHLDVFFIFSVILNSRGFDVLLNHLF